MVSKGTQTDTKSKPPQRKKAKWRAFHSPSHTRYGSQAQGHNSQQWEPRYGNQAQGHSSQQWESSYGNQGLRAQFS